MSDLMFDLLPPMACCVTSIQLTEWVGLLCTLVITIVTCGINVYRMIRDRNSDKGNKEKENQNDKKD